VTSNLQRWPTVRAKIYFCRHFPRQFHVQQLRTEDIEILFRARPSQVLHVQSFSFTDTVSRTVKHQFFFSFSFFLIWRESKQLTTRTPSFALAAYCPAISSRPTSPTILGPSSKSAKIAVHTRKNWHNQRVGLLSSSWPLPLWRNACRCQRPSAQKLSENEACTKESGQSLWTL
jgi:hypothetical protein